jgi:(1->4)-alpha-D-glucan 1-alpha-D-glucosylmutase
MRIPSATYRLQLHEDFGFDAAAHTTQYLQRLGVSELYLSPIFKAAPGSHHGYDVLDHDALNPEFGGADAFQGLVARAKACDLGLLVDFVPNHMGVGCAGNRFWEDVLEHGQSSERANYFDIDWLPPKETLAHKLLLPILPDQYGVSLENGYFRLHFDGAALCLQAGQRTLPLRPKSLGRVLTRVADLLEAKVILETTDELRSIARGFAELVEAEPGDPIAMQAYQRSARALRHRLSEFVAFVGLRGMLDGALAEISGTPSVPESFDFLDQLLRAQNYRLSSWQLALEAINYRRFFDVNDLASIRVEEPAVFDASHRKLLALVEAGAISGLRLDHVDGLFDPVAYLRKLDQQLHDRLPEAEPAEPALYMVVEKILVPGEPLPPSFRAHGTTGYEFARIASGVFIDRRAELALSDTYRRFTGDASTFLDHVLYAKRDVLSSLLVSEAMTLSRSLERLAERDRRWRDLTFHSLHGALVEVMAAFPVYRSYVRPDGTRTPEDEAVINRAVANAMRQNPTAGRGAYQFLRSLLLGSYAQPEAREFAMRFQQTTGPVLAKALEDTAFYRYTRNVAENEVGSQPERVGVEMAEFHAQNAHEQGEHKLSLTATSTHDTKRGEDTRARLSMLSELPNTWRRTAFTLARLAAKYRTAYDGSEAPARSDEYLYYQTLVGVLPFGAQGASFEALSERVQAYMLKACREAKRHSSWLHPDSEYEAALLTFVQGTLTDPDFTGQIRRFCARVEHYAACKALGQVALKLCAPGVPDTYQGSESWHQVLVDPDNRRPVDYRALDEMLSQLDQRRTDREQLIPELLEQFADGRVKLFVVSELLRLRREQPSLFQKRYLPLDAGPNCVAFARGAPRADEAGGPSSCDLLCIVPRFPFRVTRGRLPWPLGSVWGDARLSGGGLGARYRNVFTGAAVECPGSLPLREVFADFPVAVLVRPEPNERDEWLDPEKHVGELRANG